MNLSWLFGFLLLPGGLAAFALGFTMFRNARLTQLRPIAAWSIAPLLVAVALASAPSLNPLWPRHMAELEKQEAELKNSIQEGMSLEQIRDVLNSKKIAFYEFAEPTGGLVLQNSETTMTAQFGDIVLASRLGIKAFRFPCEYDLQIILLFGREGKLKQSYIRRLPICP